MPAEKSTGNWLTAAGSDYTTGNRIAAARSDYTRQGNTGSDYGTPDYTRHDHARRRRHHTPRIAACARHHAGRANDPDTDGAERQPAARPASNVDRQADNADDTSDYTDHHQADNTDNTSDGTDHSANDNGKASADTSSRTSGTNTACASSASCTSPADGQTASPAGD